MIKCLYIFIISLFGSCSAQSQHLKYEIKYKVDANNHLNSIGACLDSGVITCAGIGPSLKFFNLTKFDKYGVVEWSKNFGSSSYFTSVYNPIQLSNGDILVVGQLSLNGGNAFVMKTDSIGNIKWSRKIGSIYNDFAIKSFEENSNKYFFSGGSMDSVGNWHFLLAAIDSSGNILWNKIFGSLSQDDNFSFVRTFDNGFVMLGYTRGFGVGVWCDYYVVRLDSSGNILWSRIFGGNFEDYGRAVVQTSDSGFLLAGNTSSFGNSYDGLIIKIDKNGNLIWAKTYSNILEIDAILKLTNDEYIFSGGACQLFKTDSLGNLLWNYSYGGGYGGFACLTKNNDLCTSLYQSGDTFKLVRATPDGISCDQNAVPCIVNNVILNIDSPFTITYSLNVTSTNHIIPVSNSIPFTEFACNPQVANFSTANTLFCGGSCIDFNNFSQNSLAFSWLFPGAIPDTSTMINPVNICYSNPGTYDVTLVAFNSSDSDTLILQNYITVYPYPPPQSIIQNADTLFAIFGAANYQWYLNGNSISGATNYFYVATESGNYNVIVVDSNGCEAEAVINNVIAGINSMSLQDNFVSVSPIPVTEKLLLRSSLQILSLKILNIIGKEQHPQILLNDKTEIDIHTLSNGIYFLQVQTENGSVVRRFIKE